MNYLKLLSACVLSASFVVSCGTAEVESGDGAAEVQISLDTDGTHHTKSVAEETLPSIDDFTVEIFKKESGARLYRDTYANAKGVKIRLNEGYYSLSAFHGDSLKAGFNAAFYQALVPFSISAGQRRVNVSGTAKLANAKIAVEYGDALKTYYQRFCTSVSTDKKNVKDTLGFAQTETRAGFIPAGTLTVKLYAAELGQKMKYFHTEVTAAPNDFITLRLDTKPFTGKITIGIIIDGETETVEKTVELDATDVATDAPSIKVSDNLAAGTVEFYEGDELDGTTVDINTPAGYAHAWLDITSDWLKAKGVAERVDLADMDDATRKVFSQMGMQILKMTGDTRFAYIDFSGLKDRLKCDAVPFEGKFNLTVIDKNGQSKESGEFSLKMLKNSASLVVTEANAFARSFRDVALDVAAGRPEKYTLQYRTADGSWKNAEGTASGSKVSYSRISGMTPGTEYQFRAIYNNNPSNATDVVTVKTEDAAQVGNAGFEDWTTQTITISVALSSDRSLDWYLPYKDASDSWWAVTSKRSMPTSILATTKTSVKSFPTVAYSPDCVSGSRSAHLYTVNIGTFNTDLVASGTSYSGELFIGTADDSGNHSFDGHAFSSRPDKFTFKYKFAPTGSEKFYVKIEFKDDSGNVIASKEDTAGPASSDWTTYTADLDWTDITKKAASIYISFKSSSSSSPAVNANTTLEVAGNESQGGHFGSSLYVDDIELIYE